MKYVLLFGVIGLALLLGLGILTAPYQDSRTPSDPHHSAAFFFTIDGLREIGSFVQGVVRGLVEEFTPPSLARPRRESPKESLVP